LVYKPDFNTDLELLRKSKIIDWCLYKYW
jgi:hypothetical protein